MRRQMYRVWCQMQFLSCQRDISHCSLCSLGECLSALSSYHTVFIQCKSGLSFFLQCSGPSAVDKQTLQDDVVENNKCDGLWPPAMHDSQLVMPWITATHTHTHKRAHTREKPGLTVTHSPSAPPPTTIDPTGYGRQPGHETH